MLSRSTCAKVQVCRVYCRYCMLEGSRINYTYHMHVVHCTQSYKFYGVDNTLVATFLVQQNVDKA